MRQLWTRASRRRLRPFWMLAAMSVITLAASSPIDSAVLGSHVTGHSTALPVAAPGSASTLAAPAQASGLATSETSTKVVARDRATGDMPDDRSGPQVHFLYVVPADGTDRQLDANGAMEQSINRIERWFEAQTRDQALRIDTYKALLTSRLCACRHKRKPLAALGHRRGSCRRGVQQRGQGLRRLLRRAQHMVVRSGAVARTAEAGCHVSPCAADERPAPVSRCAGFGTGTDVPGYFEIGLMHEICMRSGSCQAVLVT
jgi:hypothetical protein